MLNCASSPVIDRPHKTFLSSIYHNILVKFIYLLLLPFCVLIAHNAIAAHSSVNVTHLDLALSQNSINHMIQDRRGFVWLATQNGLDKYDGLNVTTLADLLEPNCLYKPSHTFHILEDLDGNIWIGTTQGVIKYTRNTSCISSYLNNKNDKKRITQIFQDSKGRIWAGGSALFLYDSAQNNFRQITDNTVVLDTPFYAINNQQIPSIRAIYEDENGNIWIGGRNGLQLFNEVTQQLELKIRLNNHRHWQSNNPITNIIRDNQNNLWLGSEDGMYRYTDKQTVKYYPLAKHKSHTPISTNYITTLFKHQTDLWIGTFNGLYRYSRYDDRFIKIQHSNSDKLFNDRVGMMINDVNGRLWVSMSSGVYRITNKNELQALPSKQANKIGQINGGNVYRLLSTKSGAIYVSADLNGLYRINTSDQLFHTTRLPVDKGTIFDNNIIRSVFEEYIDSKRTLWLGLDGAGLKKIDYDNKENINSITRYLHTSAPRDSGQIGEYIHAIDRDSSNKLWIASNFGLRQWHLKKRQFVPFDLNLNGEAIKSPILTFTQQPNDKYWWLAGESILVKYDPVKEEVSQIWNEHNFPELSKVNVHKLFFDDAGELWLATTHGVFAFNTKTKVLSKCDFSSVNVPKDKQWVHGITQDSSGTFWFATRGSGLISYQKNKSKPIIQQYTSQQGLIDDVLYGLLKDDKDNLWLSSNKGLMKFSTSTKQVSYFAPEHGLQGYEFNHGAVFSGQNLRFYMGGINGVSDFYPVNIEQNSKLAEVFLTQMKVNGAKILIEETPYTLTHNQNYLEFEYISIYHALPSSVSYQYRLLGLSESWLSIGEQKKVYLQGLNPGKYVFEVRASIGSNNFGKAYPLAKFEIKKPWWQSYIAIASYMFFLISIFVVYHQGRKRVERNLKRKIAQATTSLTNANQFVRLQFENFAHEVKTPLMSVNNHCELARRDLLRHSQTLSTLEVIANINKAIDSINDIRDGVSHELKLVEQCINIDYKAVNVSIDAVITQSLQSRKNRAKDKNIVLDLQSATNVNLCAYLQPGALELIIGHLLDNAIQYSVENSVVIIVITEQQVSIDISIIDNGAGIADNDKDRVFEFGYRTNNYSNQNKGMGLYLVAAILESNNGQIKLTDNIKGGCQFTVTLPKGCFQEPKNSIINEQQTNHNSNVKRSLEKPCIVIIEDNKALAKSIRLLLSTDYEPLVAHSAKAGMQLIKTSIPDLIITDVAMEERDSGIELVKQLKNDENLSFIPIVVCSAFSSSSSQLSAITAMADAWVDKGAGIDLLEAQIKAMLAQKQRLKEKIMQNMQSQSNSIIELKDSTTTNGQANIHAFDEEQQFIAILKTVIEEHYQDPELTVEKIASLHLKNSVRNVQYKAKLLLPKDIQLKTVLMAYRGLKAIDLLTTTQYPIKRIFGDAGFSNDRQMSRWFKHYLKQTPANYRNSPTDISLIEELNIIKSRFNW